MSECCHCRHKLSGPLKEGSIAVPVKEEQVGNMQWSDWEGLFEEVTFGDRKPSFCWRHRTKPVLKVTQSLTGLSQAMNPCGSKC